MKKVTFGSVPVTGFFKESDSKNSVWLMKDSNTSAAFKENGIEGHPSFDKDEIVFIE